MKQRGGLQQVIRRYCSAGQAMIRILFGLNSIIGFLSSNATYIPVIWSQYSLILSKYSSDIKVLCCLFGHNDKGHLTGPLDGVGKGRWIESFNNFQQTLRGLCQLYHLVRAVRCLWLFVSFPVIGSRCNAENMPSQCLVLFVRKNSNFQNPCFK